MVVLVAAIWLSTRGQNSVESVSMHLKTFPILCPFHSGPSHLKPFQPQAHSIPDPSHPKHSFLSRLLPFQVPPTPGPSHPKHNFLSTPFPVYATPTQGPSYPRPLPLKALPTPGPSLPIPGTSLSRPFLPQAPPSQGPSYLRHLPLKALPTPGTSLSRPFLLQAPPSQGPSYPRPLPSYPRHLPLKALPTPGTSHSRPFLPQTPPTPLQVPPIPAWVKWPGLSILQVVHFLQQLPADAPIDGKLQQHWLCSLLSPPAGLVLPTCDAQVKLQVVLVQQVEVLCLEFSDTVLWMKWMTNKYFNG